MTTSLPLTDQDLAEQFLRRHGPAILNAGAAVVAELVGSWLRSVGLGHRDRFEVAQAAITLVAAERQAEQSATAQAEAHAADVRESFGDQHPADMEFDPSWDMPTYAVWRERAGLGKGSGNWGILGPGQ